MNTLHNQKTKEWIERLEKEHELIKNNPSYRYQLDLEDNQHPTWEPHLDIER